MFEQQLLFSFEGTAPGPEPSDASERLRCLDPARSFIVQAPAGSGKTELLIQRYLTLLSGAAAPEGVVAITFTVKAAAEMRTRVIEALAAAAGPEPEAEHARLTWTLARNVLAQDRRQAWALAQNPGRLRIQTIDALSMFIVRQMPWSARMGAMPEVTEDARRLYEQAAGNTIRLLAGDSPYAGAIEKLLRHLDFDAAITRRLIAEMLAIRDHWLRIVGVNQDARHLRAALERNLSRIVCAGLERLAQALPRDEAAELVALARHAGGHLAEDHILARCRNLTALPGAEPGDLPAWRALAELLLTAGGEWRQRVDKRHGFPAGGRAKDRFNRLVTHLRPNAAFKAALDKLLRLPDAFYSDPQWEVLEALFTVLPRAAAELRVIFGERGIVDFTEISQAALFALGTLDTPSDLALELGHRVEHLLIDEFQDTSRTQEHMIRALTAGWDGGDGRTLFLVGDPMQSIYRFRQADVGVFLSTRERGLGGLTLQPATLAANFRSSPEIVDWVNATFAQAFPPVQDAVTGAVPFSPSQAFRDSAAGSGVFVHPVFDRDDERETAETVGLIEAAAGTGERVAVLVRARTHLLETAARLRDRGIRFRAIEIDSLGERPVVQDLLALTRALLHYADRPAWLAILRAPWCGLTLEDLMAIAGDGSTTIWERLTGPGLPLSPDGESRAAGLRCVLSPALARRGRVGLRMLVEGTWVALNGPACLAGDADLADAGTYLDLLDSEDRGGDLADPDDFTRRVGDLFSAPDPAAPETLELMTIHKAKGLEFDRVIIPGLGRGTKQDDPKLFLSSEDGNGEVILAPISPRHAGGDATYRFLSGEERDRSRHEALRLLYVACTRARRQLHLVGHVRMTPEGIGKPETGSFLEYLWPSVMAHFEPPPQAPPGEHAKATAPALRRLARPAAAWVAPEPPRIAEAPAAAPSPPAASNAIGTVTHGFLERIAHDGLALWSKERILSLRAQIEFALRASGIGEQDLAEAAVSVEQALVRTCDDPRGRWVLSRHAEAASEVAVAAVVGGEVVHLQIDRTFVDEAGNRWIVDFKTGNPDEAAGHWPQLERYAAVLREFDSRPIRLALYYPLVPQWIER